MPKGTPLSLPQSCASQPRYQVVVSPGAGLLQEWTQNAVAERYLTIVMQDADVDNQDVRRVDGPNAAGLVSVRASEEGWAVPKFNLTEP